MSSKFLFSSFFFTLMLYVIFGYYYMDDINQEIVLYSTMFGFMIFYYAIILSVHWSKINSSELFYYSLFFFVFIYISIFNYIYFIHSGAFFEFTGSDSTTYHRHSIRALNYGYFEGLANFVKYSYYDFDDAGMIAYLSFLYRIIEHPLFPRFINIFINYLSVLIMYKISLGYLKSKTAILVSLIYGLSSYTLYYVSSGLKETVFLLIVLSSFYMYYRFSLTNKIRYLIYAILISFLIIFFRVPVALFVIISFGFAEILRRGLTVRKIILVMGSIIFIGILIMVNIDIVLHYVFIRNPAIYTEGGQNIFLQGVSIISAIFGPLPTFVPVSGSEADSIWAASITLKSFLSIYFLFSIYLVYKKRDPMLIAMTMMCLLHIISLAFIGRALKLRYVIPYLPFFFILSGYAYERIQIKKHKYKLFRKLVLPVNVGVFLLMIFWNLLRL